MQAEGEPQDLTLEPLGSTSSTNPFTTTRPGTRPRLRPNSKALVAVIGVLVLAVGSFSLGRAAPTDDPLRADANAAVRADPTGPGATAAPSPSPSPSPMPNAGGLAVAIKGAQVLATAPFANSSAVVICRPAESGGGSWRLSVAHIEASDEARSELLTLDEIAVVTSCDSCEVALHGLEGEAVILGECGDSSVLSGMPPERSRNSQWVFVVAEPGNELETGLAMRIHCGETSITVEGNELVVTAQVSPGGDIVRAIELPPIRFRRQGSFFVPDDPGVLNHFCTVSEFDQLQVSPWRSRRARSDLSYLQRDSALGGMGFHGPVLVALTNQQCARLFRVQRQAHRQNERPLSPPLAAEVGWDAPAGFDDWFLTCRPTG